MPALIPVQSDLDPGHFCAAPQAASISMSTKTMTGTKTDGVAVML